MGNDVAKWAPPEIPVSVVPDEAFDVGEPQMVGAIEFGEGPIEINAGREASELVLVNSGDRPIQIGAHYHLAEANRAMAFDRDAAFFEADVILTEYEPSTRDALAALSVSCRRTQRPLTGRRVRAVGGHGHSHD